MAESISNADNIAARKCHPRAKDCLIISLVPIVLIGCLMLLTILEDIYPEHHFDFVGYGKLLAMLLFISLFIQPLGIIFGIYSLFQIRKDHSYYGKVYAVSGIFISILSFILVYLFG